MSNLIERAVVSAFNYSIRQEIERPSLPLKSVERRMRALGKKESSNNIPDFRQLIQALKQGAPISIGNERYIATIESCAEEPTGGLVKRLARELDKKTKNPKTSRGTIWRRNSTVMERRRQLPGWKTSATAKLETARTSKVVLIPYNEWIQKQIDFKQQQVNEIYSKKEKRAQKKLVELELKRRYQESLTIEDIVAADFMSACSVLAETNGITNESEFYCRIRRNLEMKVPQPIIFVWGPPYEGQALESTIFEEETPEKKMAEQIEDVLVTLSQTGIEIRPLLLYADFYGSKINGIPQVEIDSYRQTLENRFLTIAQVVPWSQVRLENGASYQKLVTHFSNAVQISEKAIQNALTVQQKLGRHLTRFEAQTLASLYVLERLTEGQILYQGFNLDGEYIENCIKLATAPSRERNDDPYEAKLPRLYIKNMMRAAWNKPRSYL